MPSGTYEVTMLIAASGAFLHAPDAGLRADQPVLAAVEGELAQLVPREAFSGEQANS